MMIPQIGKRKQHYIESLLLGKKEPISVLEWGSGGSTVHFSNFLMEKGKEFEWISLEHDKEWHDRVKENLTTSSVVLIFRGPISDSKEEYQRAMKEYVSYPATLGRKFDLIFIDGRKREECLAEAFHLLKEDGVVLLDDAFRKHYWKACALFPENRFLWFSFWRGTLKEPTFLESLRYRCVNIFYKVWAIAKRFGVPVPFS